VCREVWSAFSGAVCPFVDVPGGATVTLSAKRYTGIVLVVAGALMCLAGVALYVMPGPGFPVLVLGLAAVVIGLFLLAALRRE
jgi:hypothetical protein